MQSERHRAGRSDVAAAMSSGEGVSSTAVIDDFEGLEEYFGELGELEPGQIRQLPSIAEHLQRITDFRKEIMEKMGNVAKLEPNGGVRGWIIENGERGRPIPRPFNDWQGWMTDATAAQQEANAAAASKALLHALGAPHH